VRDTLATSNPVLRSLFDRGLARAYPLHIGIEIAAAELAKQLIRSYQAAM
jgi:uncharacterized NAD(P)/FAD-binding protein YdhS